MYYYDAFGNILEQTGNVNNNILYAGYQYDKETDLYYLNSRMYDPVTARFLQEDTYYGDPNDPLSLNLYTYCHNEPLMYIEPTGQWPEWADNLTNKIGNGINYLVTGVDKAVNSMTEFVDNKIEETSNYINSKVDAGFEYIERKYEINDNTPIYSFVKDKIKENIGFCEGVIKGAADITTGLIAITEKCNPLMEGIRGLNSALS